MSSDANAEAKIDSGEPKRRLQSMMYEAEVLNIERKTLLAWSNSFLSTRGLKARTLADFSDGVLFINLVQVAIAARIPKYNARPKLQLQQIENVSIAFQAMQKQGIKLVGLNAHTVVEKQDAVILSVLFNLQQALLHRSLKLAKEAREQNSEDSGGSQAAQQTDEGAGTLAQNLLRWCQESFPELEIKDFSESFRDGRVFVALLRRLAGDSLASKEHPPGETNTQLLVRVFAEAEDAIGIPSLLNPEDFAEGKKIDERMVMSYVGMLITAAKSTLKKEQELARREEATNQRLQQERLEKEKEAEKKREEAEAVAREEVEKLRQKTQQQADKQRSELRSKAQALQELQKVCDELQVRLSGQSTELARTRRELLDATNEREVAKREQQQALNDSQSEVRNLQQQLKDSLMARQGLEHDLLQARQQAANATADGSEQLKAAQENVLSLTSQLQQAVKRADTAETHRAETAQSLQAQQEAAQAAQQAARQQLAEISRQNEELSQDKKAAEQARTELERKLQEQEQGEAERKRKCDSEKELQTQAMAELEARLQETKALLAKANESSVSERKQRDEAEAKSSELEKKFMEVERLKSELSLALEQASEEKSETLRQHKAALDSLSQQKLQEQQRAERAEAQLANAMASESAKGELQEISANEALQAKQALASLQLILDQATAREAALKQRETELMALHATATQQLATIISAAEECKEGRRADGAAFQKKIRELEEDVQGKANEMESLKGREAEAVAQLRRLRQELQEEQQKSQSLTVASEANKKTAADLQSQLTAVEDKLTTETHRANAAANELEQAKTTWQVALQEEKTKRQSSEQAQASAEALSEQWQQRAESSLKETSRLQEELKKRVTSVTQENVRLSTRRLSSGGGGTQDEKKALPALTRDDNMSTSNMELISHKDLSPSDAVQLDDQKLAPVPESDTTTTTTTTTVTTKTSKPGFLACCFGGGNSAELLKVTDELEAAKQRLASLEANLNSTREAKQLAEANCGRAQAETTKANSALREVKESLVAQQQVQKELEKEISKHTQEASELRSEVATLTENWQKSLARAQKAESQVAAHEETIAGLEADMARLSEELAASKDLASKMAGQVSDLQNEMAELKVAHEQEMQEAEAEHSAIVQDLNAEIYSVHRENEEIVERLRQEEISRNTVLKQDQPNSGDRSVHQLSLDELSQQAILEHKSDREFLNTMDVIKGMFLKRRPQSLMNKTKWKATYIELHPDTLRYWNNKAPESASVKPKGVSRLTLWSDCKIVTQEDAKSKETVVILQFVPARSQDKREALELKVVPEEEGGNSAGAMVRPEDFARWSYQANRRIALLNYLSATAKAVASRSKELLSFVTDEKMQELKVFEKIGGITEAFHALRPAMLGRPNFTTLELCNVALQDSAMPLLAEVLITSDSLRTLLLPSNLLSPAAGKTLADALGKNQSLTQLGLDNNRLGDAGVIALAEALPSHPNLCELNLTGNAIGDAGIQALCGALVASGQKNNQPHRFPTLHLKYNLVGDAGCEAIQKLCSVNPTITRIILESNSVGDAGLASLSQVLASLPQGSESEKATGSQVRELHLAQNHLSSKGIVLISEALKQSKAEILLDFSRNPLIGLKGIASIVKNDLKLDYEGFRVKKKAEGAASASADN